ncbi:hypothetical protein ACWEGQ_28905 [Streptomyces seoulensis]
MATFTPHPHTRIDSGQTLSHTRPTRKGTASWPRPTAKINEFEDKEKEKEKLKKEQAEPKKLRPYTERTFYRKPHAAGLNQRINHAQKTADQEKTKAQPAENKVNELRRSLRTA